MMHNMQDYLAVSRVGITANFVILSGTSRFFTTSFQCFHCPLACYIQLFAVSVIYYTNIYVKDCFLFFTLKSKTKSKTSPSAGGRASNLLFRMGGKGFEADLPISTSRSLESNFCLSGNHHSLLLQKFEQGS